MNKKEFNTKAKIIRETFNDKRKIKCITPQDEREVAKYIHPGEDIFTTEDGSYIDFEFQLSDFTEDELVKYVEFAEALYEKHQKPVSIYLLCPKYVNVYVKECEIKSEAEFNIKLSCAHEKQCEIILNGIKNKIKYGEPIDGDDLHALSMLPVMCERKDRNYFRREYFRIISRLRH